METIIMKNVSVVLVSFMEQLTKILSASTDLFRQYGFKTITMDDVARKAGISKKTLYHHFANKNEVVCESVSWYKCQITEMCDKTMQEAENAVEGFVRTMLLLDQIHRQINPMSMLELEKYYPDGFKNFKNLLLQNDVEAIKNNLIRGINEGYYRKEINPDFMARYRIEISLLSFQPNLLVNELIGVNNIGNEIGEHFLYGIMTTKGEELYRKYKEKYLKQVATL